VTIGGIYGTVVEAGERIRITLSDGSQMEIAPRAISGVVGERESEDSDDVVSEEPASLGEPNE
jgi:preprotein translocase subunit YajC